MVHPMLAYVDPNTALWIQMVVIMLVFAGVLLVRPKGPTN